MKKTLLCVALYLNLLSTSMAQVASQDSLALVDFYNNTGGPAWTIKNNWLQPGKQVGSWYGVGIKNNRVISVALFDNNLVGSIPTTIGNLTELILLHLYNNSLHGSLPSSIGNLTKLTSLTLMHNQLSGSLPGSIVNLTLLKDLTINHNNLSGTIPVNIGNLTNLEKLRLHNNQLEGPIPQSIGALTALDELELNNNQLTGTIPETIAAFTNLTMLSLNDNLLSGILPSEVTDLPNLFWLNLKNNQLRGPLSISLCSSSPVIQIENNHFNFDALEPISGCLQDIFITYDPQALLPLTNNNPMLSVTAGGTLSQNTYTWYKDGTPVAVNA